MFWKAANTITHFYLISMWLSERLFFFIQKYRSEIVWQLWKISPKQVSTVQKKNIQQKRPFPKLIILNCVKTAIYGLTWGGDLSKLLNNKRLIFRSRPFHFYLRILRQHGTNLIFEEICLFQYILERQSLLREAPGAA